MDKKIHNRHDELLVPQRSCRGSGQEKARAQDCRNDRL